MPRQLPSSSSLSRVTRVCPLVEVPFVLVLRPRLSTACSPERRAATRYLRDTFFAPVAIRPRPRHPCSGTACLLLRSFPIFTARAMRYCTLSGGSPAKALALVPVAAHSSISQPSLIHGRMADLPCSSVASQGQSDRLQGCSSSTSQKHSCLDSCV